MRQNAKLVHDHADRLMEQAARLREVTRLDCRGRLMVASDAEIRAAFLDLQREHDALRSALLFDSRPPRPA